MVPFLPTRGRRMDFFLSPLGNGGFGPGPSGRVGPRELNLPQRAVVLRHPSLFLDESSVSLPAKLPAGHGLPLRFVSLTVGGFEDY